MFFAAKKLRARVNLAIVVTLLTISVLFVSIIVPFQQERLKTITRKIELLLTTTVSQRQNTLANAIFEQRTRSLRLQLQKMQELEGILAIRVFDATGKLLHATDSVGTPLDFAQHPDTTHIQPSLWQSQNCLKYFHPLEVIGERIGFITIYYSLADVEKEQQFSWILFIGLLLSILLTLAVLLNTILSKMVIHPIASLGNAMQAIQTEHKLGTQVPVQSNDEIGDLGKAFNQMSKDLANSYQKLKHHNEELKHLDALKDEFLANTSHELRTPLNGIIGLSEALLDEGQWSKNQRESLSLIINSGKRLSNLINDLLDFSKLRGTELHLQWVPVDVFQLVELVLSLVQPLVGEKPLLLQNHIPKNIPLAYADENRLQQILHNLIGNAVKFTHEGKVTLSAEIKDHAIHISIADTGIGIPSEKQNRIFEAFEQGEGSISREYGGTGIGLSITKKLVELHQGTLTVQSGVGNGSIFSFSLPLSKNQNRTATHSSLTTTDPFFNVPSSNYLALQKPSSSPLEPPIEQQTTILVVDDERINLEVLKNTLSPQNYRTMTAQSGFQALEILETEMPDLILLDLMMPRMTGYEVCEKVRQRYNSTQLPILIVTAKNQVENVVQGLRYGANDYLTKPFHKDELLARIKHHLQLKAAIQDLKQAERFEHQLQTAHTVQELLLPKSDPQFEELELASYYQSADETGGDWFHYRYDPLQQTLDVLIGDVTGHGVPAALITAIVDSFYHSQDQYRLKMGEGYRKQLLFHPTYQLEILNDVLFGTTQGLYTMTFFYSSLDLAKKQLHYSAAAHNPCLVWRPSYFDVKHHGKKRKRAITQLQMRSYPLGYKAQSTYPLESLDLQKDDVIVWYTDGLIENANEQGEIFGFSRLQRLIKKCDKMNATEIKDCIIDAVGTHCGNHPFEDDVTLVVGKVL